MANPSKQLIDPPLRYLTKSLVRTALTCPRKLVYAANPKLYPRSDNKVTDPFVMHLKDEGLRFGEYCRKMFPHGIEVGLSAGSNEVENTTGENGDSVPSKDRIDDLVRQTNQMLRQDYAHERVTVFEGAVRSGSFYIRPDILDKIIHPNPSKDNPIELRVIEVKSKSYDSRPSSKKGLMWNTKKKSIKATFLPYIQDIAFQSLVTRRAFPDYVVSSWLMLPDRGKVWNGDDIACSSAQVPSVDETMNTIDMSSAALLNVDELVQFALESEVSFPGSNGEIFQDVVEQWAEQFNANDLESSFSEVPIGSQCALCKYRTTPDREELDEHKDNATESGFDVCWQKVTGLNSDEMQQPLVIDMYGYTKQSINKFIREGKLALKDLSADDLLSTKEEPIDKISSRQRRWYQVSSLKNSLSDNFPQYILRRDNLQKEMDQWQYPWHFIDFETSAPILPYYKGMAPYELFAFQFSHHVIHENQMDKALHISEFLHSERGTCPNKQFLCALYDAIGTEGTVFQWSTHENSVLKSLLASKEADELSNHEKESLSALLSDNTRSMVDLCKLASDYYYVDGSGGSSSIKRLLSPTLNASRRLKEIYGTPSYNSSNFADFQWYQQDERGNAIDPYKILAGNLLRGSGADDEMSSVTHGGGAAAAFHELENTNMSEQELRYIEKSLLRYCELDTLSMTMIVQAWQGFLEDS